MKLTNKQISIVIDEIYKQVSVPIIEENKAKIDAVVLEEDNYMKDYRKVQELREEIKKIENCIDGFELVYVKKNINGFGFPNYDYDIFRERTYDRYIDFLKNKLVELKQYPSKEDIEKEIILAGNKDIPELISNLVVKLKQ